MKMQQNNPPDPKENKEKSRKSRKAQKEKKLSHPESIHYFLADRLWSAPRYYRHRC
jgi:hypothetical protein